MNINMENTTKSATYDFSIRRGEYDVHKLISWTVNGQPFNLSEAEEVRVDFRMNPRLNGPPDLSLTVSNGGLELSNNDLSMLFGVNTIPLYPGIYFFDVLVVKSDVRCNWVRGKMVLENIITR